MHTVKYSVPKYIFLLLIQNKNLAISYINLFKSTFRIKTIQDHDCYCSLKTAPVLCAGGRHRVLSLRQPVHLCSRLHTETSPTHTHSQGPMWSPHVVRQGTSTHRGQWQRHAGLGPGGVPSRGKRTVRPPPSPLPGPLHFRCSCWRTSVFCLCPGFSRLSYVGHVSYRVQ